MYEDVRSPVHLLMAEVMWRSVTEVLKPTTVHTLPGIHHAHADRNTYDAIVESVLEYVLLD